MENIMWCEFVSQVPGKLGVGFPVKRSASLPSNSSWDESESRAVTATSRNHMTKHFRVAKRAFSMVAQHTPHVASSLSILHM